MCVCVCVCVCVCAAKDISKFSYFCGNSYISKFKLYALEIG